MTFRPATIDDEDFFWYWRERAEFAYWYGGAKTTREQHGEWFRTRLDRITMLVWERPDRGPAGIVRVESNGELAFDAQPSLMVRLLEEFKPYASDFGRFKVTVDDGDKTKARALKAAGFVESPVRFFCYRP
jgi:hypothetical protein